MPRKKKRKVVHRPIPEFAPPCGEVRKPAKPLSIHTAIQSAKDALSAPESTETVSLDDLATSLGIDKEKVLDLVQKGYFRQVEDGTFAAPPAPAMNWLRDMLSPLKLRPMVSLEMVSLMTGMNDKVLRRMCIFYNIPMRDDDHFGELLTIEGLYDLWNKVAQYRDPTRFDRQAFIQLFQEKGKGAKPLRTKPLEFSEKLEKEVTRIVRLPEPRRTFAATSLWNAYRDAVTITECVLIHEGNPLVERGVRSSDLASLRARLEVALRRLALPASTSERD